MVIDILLKRDFFADIIIITTFFVKYKGGNFVKIVPSYQLSVLGEEEFAEKMSAISEQLECCRHHGTFEGFDGKSLYYEYFQAENSRGAVIIVHGLSEFTEK